MSRRSAVRARMDATDLNKSLNCSIEEIRHGFDLSFFFTFCVTKILESYCYEGGWGLITI